MNLFVSQLFSNPMYFLTTVILVVFSICLHECFHAMAALREGDDTAAINGHITLNPMKQMGPMSLILLALFGLAWGMVPVNPRLMRSRWSPAKVAFAGPLANLLLFLFFACATAAVLSFSPDAEWRSELAGVLFTGTYLNLILFSLNMFPAYPFDGWTILYTIHPFPRVRSEALNVISIVMIMLLFAFFGKFSAFFVELAERFVMLLCDAFVYLQSAGA